jgi:hypothetical protein
MLIYLILINATGVLKLHGCLLNIWKVAFAIP